ncbi:hypothetical protein RhiJN_06717 [Ceratobasidium sp. AG-Ba]|nr:hypothetical protein RhiJN_06717 [Ceratobasidium sp. AG-Ba]QRW07630.1 hypothetical protein RhiLY_06629 [Ceratobasidium sp. AG-Ba]
MSEVPANTPVTLRYIPDVTKAMADTKAFGGLYATAPESGSGNAVEVADLHTPPEFNQKWLFVPDGRGIKLQLAPPPPLSPNEGIGPVRLPYGWKDSESKLSGPVVLSELEFASNYYLNVLKKTSGGWIVTICPIGTFFSLGSCVAASKDNQLELVGVPPLVNIPCPGWFVEETSGRSE